MKALFKKIVLFVSFFFFSASLFAAGPISSRGGAGLGSSSGQSQSSAGGQNQSNQGKKDLNVRLSQLSSDKYPEIKAYVTVDDPNGDAVVGISNTSWQASVDDIYNKVNLSIAPFATSSEYISYNIIFSNSLVVGSGLLNVQTQAILNLVSNIADKDKISVYTMGDTSNAICEDVLKNSFDFSVISTLEATEQQSRVYDSIADCLQKISKKKDERKVLIVISDERDFTSRLSAQQFQAILEQSNIPIYSIGVRRPSDSAGIKLEDMSNLSGGKYYYTPMTRELSATLLKISDYINTAYIIRAKVDGLSGDNMQHYFTLDVDIRDAAGFSSKYFIAYKQSLPIYVWILLIILALLIIAGLIILIISLRRSARSKMGISRKCPDCGNLMKDNWDTCLFCLYKPELKNKKKHNNVLDKVTNKFKGKK